MSCLPAWMNNLFAFMLPFNSGLSDRDRRCGSHNFLLPVPDWTVEIRHVLSTMEDNYQRTWLLGCKDFGLELQRCRAPLSPTNPAQPLTWCACSTQILKMPWGEIVESQAKRWWFSWSIQNDDELVVEFGIGAPTKHRISTTVLEVCTYVCLYV